MKVGEGMVTVVLAEKPSQAKEYANAFQHSSRKNGYYEVEDRILGSGKSYVTYGFGHLVELVPPGEYDSKWEKWSLESLPIFPSEFEFTVPKDKEEQFNVVAKLLKRADRIIIATDSDREGENIAWSIIRHAGAYSKEKTYKRLWLNSLERNAILEGFQNLREGMDYYSFYEEARTRQIADWLIGMNGSPLYSLALQAKGATGSFSLGRVQTPTLYMIYERQKAIETFVKRPFFECIGEIVKEKKFNVAMKPNQKFETRESLLNFLKENSIATGSNSGVVTKMEKEVKQQASPQLFSLSALQSLLNKEVKATASDTLKAVQTLYEARVLSYPRTDCQFITNNEFSYLKEVFPSYCEFLGVENQMIQSESRKRFVDDSKVQEHHAIIPTKQVLSKSAFEELKPLEKKVYEAVMKRTVAMFLVNYQYEQTAIEINVNQLVFGTKGNVPIDLGWKSLFGTNKEETSNTLPAMALNESVKVNLKAVEKETTPPKPFTEGTLLDAMKRANRFVEDEASVEILKEIEGIGTEATRASIIEAIKRHQYIETVKGNLLVTEKGKILCQAVASQNLLTSAEMTAKWESYLKKIGQKEGNPEAFIKNIQKFILHLVGEVPKDIAKLDLSEYEKSKQEVLEKSIVGKCPRCNEGNIVSKKTFFSCSNYPTCKFTLADNFRKKKLTKKNISDLLAGKETLVSKIKKNDKSTYDANVKLSDKGYIEFFGFPTKKDTKK